MDCELAANLICARNDGELAGGDPASLELEAHLAECAACRATADALQVQDAALVRAFAPRRQAAEAVAERAIAAREADNAPHDGARAPRLAQGASRRMRFWIPLASAVAAGVVVAALTLRPWQWRGRQTPPIVSTPQPVAQIALSSGRVFGCPTHGESAGQWQPLAAGATVDADTLVRTEASARCELRLPDGSQVRLNGSTQARFGGERAVELSAGQLWSAVPEQSAPLRVDVTAAGKADRSRSATAVAAPGGHFDLACTSDAAVLTVVRGAASLTDGKGGRTDVPAGESLKLVNGVTAGRTKVEDVLLATRWLNDLLVLKGRDDPELAERVNELLSRINAESAATRPATAPGAPGPVERDVRAQGHLWSSPMACYVQSPQSQADRQKRLTAARLLADLAPPWAIPDLISLLADADGEVRYHAASALYRLTGQTLGQSPEQCVSGTREAALEDQKKWQAWWEQNRERYAAPR